MPIKSIIDLFYEPWEINKNIILFLTYSINQTCYSMNQTYGKLCKYFIKLNSVFSF